MDSSSCPILHFVAINMYSARQKSNCPPRPENYKYYCMLSQFMLFSVLGNFFQSKHSLMDSSRCPILHFAAFNKMSFIMNMVLKCNQCTTSSIYAHFLAIFKKKKNLDFDSLARNKALNQFWIFFLLSYNH